MRNVAIIPARAGSKRIVKKNTKVFHGKPMIAWVIELALKSGFFEQVVVSTDSREIAELSQSLGATTPFIRPNNISDDHTSVFEVIRHAIKFYEEKEIFFDLTTLIYPTAPFLLKSDLWQGIKVINHYDFCVSVALYPYPIQRALAIREGSETIGMIEKENFLKRSQDLPVCYHDAGQFIIGKTVSWRKNTPLVSGETFPIVIPRLRVQDIDDEEDWLEAEAKFALLEDYRVCKN